MERKTVLMAGNPNVGKTSLFNLFTGLRQHTGNWPGKTVGCAYGYADTERGRCLICDTPGTYSLNALSQDEKNARDAIIFSEPERLIVVCDACCLERGLFLTLQIMQLHGRVSLCVNMMDEAEKRGMRIDFEHLEKMLGCPVTGVSAAKEKEPEKLLLRLLDKGGDSRLHSFIPCEADQALRPLTEYFSAYRCPIPASWLALQLMVGDEGMLRSLRENYGLDEKDIETAELIEECDKKLLRAGIRREELGEMQEKMIRRRAGEICSAALSKAGAERDLRLDRLLSKGFFANAAMLALLFFVLWLSIFAAEKPGQLLAAGLEMLGLGLRRLLELLPLPAFAAELLCDGVYATAALVISVMLPPMAIFFPLFTLLEDWGLLPRIAFNMDSAFRKCGSCGRQALTMCMGLGCNTVGISGCRIIDSPKEKLIAALTNSFMPCNGRFPLLISMAAFIFRNAHGPAKSIGAAGAVMGAIVLSAGAGFAASALLSRLLKGHSSLFIMELPPFRRPALGRVVLRAVLDRTVFVVLRALKAAAPAGALIWLLARPDGSGESMLVQLSGLLDPAAELIGLDGSILLAFILGLPASEIVLPLIIMSYLSCSGLSSLSGEALHGLLLAHGWDGARAACVMAFSMMHWPCFSALAAIKEECGAKYIPAAAALPTVFGLLICGTISLIAG